jgi:hypothetical protein
MNNPIDKSLYNYVKKLANKKFKSPTGVYRSSWIVKKYKSLGGRYKKISKDKNSGLKRWYKEKWINLKKPIKNKDGKIIGYEKCGRKNLNDPYPLCRPSKKVSFKTPVIYSKLSKKAIQKAKRDKKNYKSIKFQYGSGTHFSQFYGKHSNIMIKVPENVKKTAQYAFKLKKLGFKGGLETGWKRAKQLSTKTSIPIQDLKYMRAWFARHFYTSYPSYKAWKNAGKQNTPEWHNKHGIIAWIIWGGSPAFKWVNSTKNINLLNKYYNKDYKPLVKNIV